MTDVEVLEAYRYALLEEQALEKQREHLSEKCLARTSDAARRLELCRQLQERCGRELSTVFVRFEVVMSSIRAPKTRAVIRQYYGLGMTDEAIAEDLHCSPRAVNLLRNRFIRERNAAWSGDGRAHSQASRKGGHS